VVGEHGRLEVGRLELLADRYPTWPYVVVLSEQLDPPAAQTKSLYDLVELIWLLCAAQWGLLAHYYVGIDVGVDDVSIQGSSHCSFYAHKAMLLGVLQDRSGFLIGGYQRLLGLPLVGIYPHDVLTSTVSPFVQAMPPSFKTFLAAAPAGPLY